MKIQLRRALAASNLKIDKFVCFHLCVKWIKKEKEEPTTMGIKIGHNACTFAQQRDNTRIDRSERRASYASMEARTARRSERAFENSQFEIEEGTLYEAGIAD
ncbi:hypothetical protein ABEB36_008840 [Hypothenemus hampei]|uniref:Uncharacterized protein n=1 Tax=Hypothenemus hampei TaxID=57062 RepID=A0ABD1ES90_HYPHA